MENRDKYSIKPIAMYTFFAPEKLQHFFASQNDGMNLYQSLFWNEERAVCSNGTKMISAVIWFCKFDALICFGSAVKLASHRHICILCIGDYILMI